MRRAALEKTAASSRRGSRVDDPTAYHAEGVLCLAPNARFTDLLEFPEGGHDGQSLGQALNDAMRTIERDNPQLSGAARAKWQRILALLDWRAPHPQPSTQNSQPPQCPACGKPMRLIGTLPRCPP